MARKRKFSDGFAKTAIGFILGVVVGFTLLLMGFVFLMIGLLATTTDKAALSSLTWYIIALASIVIGSLMMYRNLHTVPPPDSYK